jgi:hypothetical protein
VRRVLHGRVFERVHFSLASSGFRSYAFIEHVQILPWRINAMLVITCYVIYLLISVSLTVWVARTLFRSGRVFLLDAFRGNSELADSVSHLLVVGFYLINIGYVAVALKTTDTLSSVRSVIELESLKIGIVLLILGIMHFFNIFVLARMRRRGSPRAEVQTA